MSCERYEYLLIAYMDGRATDAERIDVDRHLLACSACRTRVEEFRSLWAVLDESPAPQVSPAFDARLRARIAAEPKPSWISWLPAPRMTLATALLMILSIWVGTHPANGPEGMQTLTAEEEASAAKDLQALKDLDVLVNFEALSELPGAPQSKL